MLFAFFGISHEGMLFALPQLANSCTLSAPFNVSRRNRWNQTGN